MSSGPLSVHGQTQRVTSTAVGSGLFQPLDVVQDFSAQVVLNLHLRKHGREVQDLLVGELTNTACGVDVEAGHDTVGGEISNSEEALKGFLLEELRISRSIGCSSPVASH